LHPSALRRLVRFLRDIASRNNFIILFSTHSIELIRDIPPKNIYYLERHIDDSIEIINPCYPAYATKNLNDNSMGYDIVFLVEDDLAKEILERILKTHNMFERKLISILPCGGWSNTIRFAYNTMSSNILSTPTKVYVVLDGDVKVEAERYLKQAQIEVMKENISYLPIESLEKMLKSKLATNVDHRFHRYLNDTLFSTSLFNLNTLIQQYATKRDNANDNNGKLLCSLLIKELKRNNKERENLVETVVNYIVNESKDTLQELVCFLQGKTRV